MRKRLKELCCLPAMSGYEDEAGKYIYREFSRFCSNVKSDTAGNIMAEFKGKIPGAKKVMIFAHMDQLGLVVRRVDEAGFLYVERAGGVPEKILPGLEVSVRTESGKWVSGVIGNKSHHASDPADKTRVTPIRELYVDLGLESREDAEAFGITTGCPVVYKGRFAELGKDRCYGTALDNRGGCAVLLDLAEKLSKEPCEVDVVLAATVCEEFNLRGAMVCCAAVKPDFAIALDVNLAGDTPDMKGMFPVSLGGGPVLSMYNFHGRGTLNGTIPHPLLVKMAEQAASELGIKLQRNASVGILTDASYVQLCGTGVPSMDLGFACRYTHTAAEMCSIKDLKDLSELVERMVRTAPGDIDFTRHYE